MKDRFIREEELHQKMSQLKDSVEYETHLRTLELREQMSNSKKNFEEELKKEFIKSDALYQKRVF